MEWDCDVCKQSYSMRPELIEREKQHHGPDKCGMATETQRVPLNVVNYVRKVGSQGETFGEALWRVVQDYERLKAK